MNFEKLRTVGAGCCSQVRHIFISTQIFFATIGIVAVINRIGANENIKRTNSFAISKGVRKKYCVSCRDIGDGDNTRICCALL